MEFKHPRLSYRASRQIKLYHALVSLSTLINTCNAFVFSPNICFQVANHGNCKMC
jgi:hypothetical protein